MKKTLDYILFYCILIPLSLLPLWILYPISRLMYFVIYRLIGYRKEVVINNLRNSFPEKSQKEINTISKEFYKHLADIFIEALKMLTIRKNNLLKRYRCVNPEILDNYYKNNQSVILVSAHYNNWEYMVASLGLHFSHHGIGVGKRMSDKYFEKLMHKKRTRYSTEVCYADNTKETFKKYIDSNTPCVYMLLSDQSPNDKNKCFWTRFLNQDTAVIYGAEHLAKKYNFPVFYYSVKKEKRGYYSFEIFPITDKPQETEYGFITQSHVSHLEKAIKQEPQYWLWSHKRWKLKRE